MKIGTKSILFGYHQFLLHPLLVAWSWWRLYGFPWDPRLWACFILHDIGYWGKSNMDGPEGEDHVLVGAGLVVWMFGDDWGELCLFHSRFYAKRFGVTPSRLCWADKRVIAVTPTWIQLLLMNVTGEIKEYMNHDGSNGRTAGIGCSQSEWCTHMRSTCREAVARATQK